ncbi:restriction endonuclease, SacI family [Stratiformator vulcanicus]|uniref:SacI restriction endonuclease n=1 Tax=Stratiformator vulcanicus TaxID=2527980 RepID=A0A517QW32_9PLAN|nr:restriction endonuclease, SacI family [Stratiformator vulcanicus]QDT35787.1 SacI restriction endonuclease [Stratiformator vulcanicus]
MSEDADPSEIFTRHWQRTLEGNSDDVDTLPVDIKDAIDRSINSRTKSYRYVLPTQLLAKLAFPNIDCRWVQKGTTPETGFDARSFCSRNIVPFDRDHESVLGGSGDPYVNNPLRIPVISVETATNQKNRSGFNDLISVLGFVEENPGSASAVFDRVLQAIHKRLATTSILYPVPDRISVGACQTAISEFISVKTGGRRLQIVSTALFDTYRDHFGFCAEVKTGKVNQADAAKGNSGDIECLDERGEVKLAIEVKDRMLTLIDVQSSVETARRRKVTELLFLARGEILDEDVESVETIISRQFTAGHNVYRLEFDSFLNHSLILFGESGRSSFVTAVGNRLDELGELADRQAWSSILLNV